MVLSNWIKLSASLLLLSLLFAGCAPAPRGGEPLTAIEQSLVDGTPNTPPGRTPPPPPEIRSALIPLAKPLNAVVDFEPPRFDIAATQVPAREFFLSLVEGSMVNMVVHPEVTGEISVDLKNTTIEDVLAVIHNVYGYPYVRTGNTYQVMPVGLQARTFQVNYLNLVRRGMSQTRVSSGQVTEVGKSDTSEENDEESGSAGGTVSGSRIDTESLADFWSEFREAIQGIVGTAGGRKVVVQPQASVVVVVAMPDELQLVEDYLRTIQHNLHRQVVIEAKVIEVTLDDGFQAGINWAVLASHNGKQRGLAGQVGGGTINETGVSEISGDPIEFFADELLPNGFNSSAFGGVFGLALNFSDFEAFIELLESQGDVQVLSSPRIATVNNQKAVIKVGSDEFFVTDISSDTVTGTTTSSSTDITLTPFFSGIALDVTPQIDEMGRITLHIHPTVSEVTDQTKELNVFGENQVIPLAFSTVRESDSIVHAENGQLVVLGGLMQETISKTESGVPLLSKLPGLGALFRHTLSETRKSELVILLRPHVISSPGDWQNRIEASRQRIDNLSPEFRRTWLKN